MMIKGTTPTLTLTLPEEVDLEQASHVFITFANKDNKRLLELQDDEIEIAENEASVYLDQRQTLSFPEIVKVQLNWTYTEAGTIKRACTNIATVAFNKNLKTDVVTEG